MNDMQAQTTDEALVEIETSENSLVEASSKPYQQVDIVPVVWNAEIQRHCQQKESDARTNSQTLQR